MKNHNYYLSCLLVIAATLSAEPALAEEDNEKLFVAARDGAYESVYQLIGQGANVNYGNLSRETPMHAAASKGHLEVMRLLEANGARHDRRTSGNWMPLHHAVRFGHIQAAHYLLTLGTPLYVRTKDGKTVFDIAAGAQDKKMLHFLEAWRRELKKK